MSEIFSELENNLKDAPIEDYMLGVSEELLRVLREDKQKLVKAIEQRQKQIDRLLNDQESDKTTLSKVDGGLSVATSLVSKYRVRHQAHKRQLDAKAPKRRLWGRRSGKKKVKE